jgi:2-desacetyl-2-hydroxyethyl bacteriochlorophyllide A dehydrogenase
MWTSTLDLDLKRILLTRLLGRFWSGAYFSSFAPLRVQQLPRQPLAASNWVRVRNRLAGICGSDLQLLTANGDLRVAPAALPQYKQLFPGHEVVGEVIEIGDDVQHLRVGDRVALQYGGNCLASGIQKLCRACNEGCYNLCENSSLPTPLQIGGGWSEEMLVSEQQLFRIPDTLTDEQAVLLEPCAVAVHAVLRHLPHPGEQVLIIGAGTIGLLTLQVMRILSPQAEISVLARHPFQIEQATRMGAAHIIYQQDSYVGIQRVTHAQIYRGLPGNQMLIGGYDAIFDTVGKRKTLHHALRWAHTRAAVVLVGLDLHLMRIDLTPIWHQELNLLGVRSHGLENWPPGTQEQRSSFEVAVELMQQGHLHPEFLITHHYALTNYQNAILTAATKAQSRAIKVVFDYSLLPASVVPNVRASARRRRPGTAQSAPEDLETQDFPLEPDDPINDDADSTQQPLAPPVEPQPVQLVSKKAEPVPVVLPIEENTFDDNEEVQPAPDPHSTPTLREEAFLTQHEYQDPDWVAPPVDEYSFSQEVPEAYDASENESSEEPSVFSSPDRARYDLGRNNLRSSNNKKKGRR